MKYNKLFFCLAISLMNAMDTGNQSSNSSLTFAYAGLFASRIYRAGKQSMTVNLKRTTLSRLP